jgi:hypothetical protein
MIEEHIEGHAFFCVSSEQPEEEILKLHRGAGWNSERIVIMIDGLCGMGLLLLWSEICIFLVKVLQLLRCVSLEWRLARQTLEHDRAERPQICLCVILQRHYHLGCHVPRLGPNIIILKIYQ